MTAFLGFGCKKDQTKFSFQIEHCRFSLEILKVRYQILLIVTITQICLVCKQQLLKELGLVLHYPLDSTYQW